MEIGKINHLKIARKSDPGLYLSDEDESEVLLPNRYVLEQMKIGDSVEVFVYTDSEDRIVATTDKPKAYLDEFAYLEIVDITPIGSFIDIGLEKDILLPKKFQSSKQRVGDKKVVRICLDKDSDRLYASEKIGAHLSTHIRNLHQNSEVDIFIIAKTPLGYKAIINNSYEGMLYDNEIFEPLHIGARKKGYIKKLRDDFKIDLSLQPIGKNNKIEGSKAKILHCLEAHEKRLNITTKSSPQEIEALFAMSKKEFKRALNTLIEQKSVALKEGYIELL